MVVNFVKVLVGSKYNGGVAFVSREKFESVFRFLFERFQSRTLVSCKVVSSCVFPRCEGV